MIRYLKNTNVANSLWNIADIFLYPVCFFISVPFFISQLGDTDFGIWMLINTIIIVMQVFNFGIGPAVLKNTAYYAGLNKKKETNSIFNNALSITLLLFLLSILCTAILSFAVYYFGVFNLDKTHLKVSAICISLSGAIIGFRFIEQVFTNFYKAFEKFKDAALISTGNRILPLFINIFLLFIEGFTIIHLLITIIISNCLITLLGYINIRKKLTPYPFHFSLKQQIKLSGFALIVWIQSLLMILIFQTDRYLVVHFFGLSVLSYYALTATIFNHLHMGFTAVLGWIVPKFTKLQANDMEVQNLYNAAQYFVVLTSTIALTFLFLIYPYLFQLLWGKTIVVAIDKHVRYFIIFELIFATSIVPTFYLNAVGYEKRLLYFIVFYSLSAIMSMTLMTYYYPNPLSVLQGLIMVSLVAMIILNFLTEYTLLNKKMTLLQPLKYLIPPFLSFAIIFYTNGILQLVLLVIALFIFCFIFMKSKSLFLKLLLQS